MNKRNLTIRLDAQIVLRTKAIAARRGTSVSALVASQLTELVDADERYDLAWRRAQDLLADAQPRAAVSWSRDELHER